MNILIYDTETTDKIPKGMSTQDRGMPFPVQLAAILYDHQWIKREVMSVIIHPEVEIQAEAADIHGITYELTSEFGIPLEEAVLRFNRLLLLADRASCHNVDFDTRIMERSYRFLRLDHKALAETEHFCTMKESTDFCKIPSEWKKGYFKWPTLQEAYKILVDGAGFHGAHDALADVEATQRVYSMIHTLRREEAENGS